MSIRVNGPGLPENAPSAQEFRSMLLENVPLHTLESVAAWLGLESVQRESADIFDLAQSLVDSIELQKDLKGFESFRVNGDEVKDQ